MAQTAAIQQRLVELIIQAKGGAVPGPITGRSHLLDDIGLDSLQLINLVLAIEDEFGVDVDFESFQVEHLSSLDQFTHFIQQLPKAA